MSIVSTSNYNVLNIILLFTKIYISYFPVCSKKFFPSQNILHFQKYEGYVPSIYHVSAKETSFKYYMQLLLIFIEKKKKKTRN